MKFYTHATDVEFLISVGYKSEKIINHFGTEFEGSKISYINEDEPLGTGGALLKILNDGAIGPEPFFMVNGDSFIEYNFNEMYSAHIESNAALTMGTMRANEVNRYGGVEVENGSNRIIGFSSGKCGVGETSNAGMYIFSNSEYLHESLSTCGQKFSFESDFLIKYVSSTIVNQFETNGDFLDIGVPKDYRKVDNFFKQRSS